MTERKIVIPGEAIAQGDDFLPGEGTQKTERGIIALRYGLAEETNKLVKVIPLSGVYTPRRGNIIIGQVKMITGNGWIITVNPAENGFLSLTEIPRYVNKGAMNEIMDVDDTVAVKIWNIGSRGIDLSVKSKGLGKLNDGIIIEINPHKVPRVIGKEGSMIKMIKDETNCDIIVGQNGFIWIKGNKIEDELFAKRAIIFVTEKSFVPGLTEELQRWFKEQGGKK